MRSFVVADLETQASLGAKALLVPGAIPEDAHEDVTETALELIDAAQLAALDERRPCLAFVGAHSSWLARAHALIDLLPV
jgi:hypothetical protein